MLYGLSNSIMQGILELRSPLCTSTGTTRQGLDYLVTWNCTHIANGQVLQRLIKLNDLRGWHTPLVVTPGFLIEGGL